MIVFRSVVVPLKAAVMNLLSIGAAYGVVVAVFQWGWLGGLFGLDGTYRIASPLPVIFFAVLFGLSMDYEVFLVSRIREAYHATGDNAESVARGLASTGRVITSGALIMVCVFLSFVTNPSPFVQMIGLGLATAIAIDATVVRMVLVPATMALMGRANWWLPGWLDRLLPHLSLESDPPAPATAPVSRAGPGAGRAADPLTASAGTPAVTAPGSGGGRSASRLDDRRRVGLVIPVRAQRPLQLELDLLLVVTALVLDGELGPFRDPDPLARDLDPERLVLLESVGEAAQLGDHLLGRVDPFHISFFSSHDEGPFRCAVRGSSA